MHQHPLRTGRAARATTRTVLTALALVAVVAAAGAFCAQPAAASSPLRYRILNSQAHPPWLPLTPVL